MDIVSVIGVVFGALNSFLGLRKDKREQQKEKPTVEMVARSSEHRIERTDTGDFLRVKVDVGLKLVEGPPTRVAAVSWNGYSGTWMNEDYRSDSYIDRSREIHVLYFHFRVPVTGGPEAKAKDIDSEIEVEFDKGGVLTFQALSKFTVLHDLRSS